MNIFLDKRNVESRNEIKVLDAWRLPCVRIKKNQEVGYDGTYIIDKLRVYLYFYY